MKISRTSRRGFGGFLARFPLLGILVAGSVTAPTVFAQDAGEIGGLELRDQILAVVDEDPILSSDVDRILALGMFGGASDGPEGSDREEAGRRNIVKQLIDERLRFHEVERFGFEEIPVELVEEHLDQIRQRFVGSEALAERLREVGLTEDGLRHLVTRQLLVLTYVEERLGARIFVGMEDIQLHYEEELTPELRASGLPVPPVDEVREQIRTVLRERRLNEEIRRWTEELRSRADIQIQDGSGGALPPVIDRIDG